jgi:hypothetical protein
MFVYISPCSLVKVHGALGTTYYLLLQGLRVSPGIRQASREVTLIALQPWSWRQYLPPKCRCTAAIRHGLKSRKITSCVSEISCVFTFAFVCSFSLTPRHTVFLSDYSPEQLCFYDIIGVTTISIKIRHWTNIYQVRIDSTHLSS